MVTCYQIHNIEILQLIQFVVHFTLFLINQQIINEIYHDYLWDYVYNIIDHLLVVDDQVDSDFPFFTDLPTNDYHNYFQHNNIFYFVVDDNHYDDYVNLIIFFLVFNSVNVTKEVEAYKFLDIVKRFDKRLIFVYFDYDYVNFKICYVQQVNQRFFVIQLFT